MGFDVDGIGASGQEPPRANRGANAAEKHPDLKKAVGALALLVLVAGAVLWGIGASRGMPGMLMAGKVLTLVPVGLFGWSIARRCCNCCGCHFGDVVGAAGDLMFNIV